jgi:hypothetical protein
MFNEEYNGLSHQLWPQVVLITPAVERPLPDASGIRAETRRQHNVMLLSFSVSTDSTRHASDQV